MCTVPRSSRSRKQFSAAMGSFSSEFARRLRNAKSFAPTATESVLNSPATPPDPNPARRLFRPHTLSASGASPSRGVSPIFGWPVYSREELLDLRRRLLTGNVQEVLHGADALDLARLGAEILDQIGLLELAAQVDDAVFDIDVDLS